MDAVIVDAAAAVAAAGAEPSLEHDGSDLLDPMPGAVLARVGNWRPDSVLAALEVAVRCGVATPNPPEAIRIGRDHWRTVMALGEAGLPVPRTLAGADPESLAAAAGRLGFPVVVKQRRSRMGVGVIRCDACDQLEAVLDTLWRLGDEVVVQRYHDTGGTSLRLLVVEGSRGGQRPDDGRRWRVAIERCARWSGGRPPADRGRGAARCLGSGCAWSWSVRCGPAAGRADCRRRGQPDARDSGTWRPPPGSTSPAPWSRTRSDFGRAESLHSPA